MQWIKKNWFLIWMYLAALALGWLAGDPKLWRNWEPHDAPIIVVQPDGNVMVLP